MPLIQPVLQLAIKQVFDAALDDTQQIADRIALAYQNYAMPALGPAGAPGVFTGIEYKRISAQIAPLLKSHAPLSSLATALGLGVFQFWMAPPILFAPGTVTAIITTPGEQLLSSAQALDTNTAASNLANALEAMTRTVIVTYPIPPGPPPGPLL